jgi:preprotein translocase subunit SecG
MLQVVLVIHLMIAVALIAVVLMQKSEGGALGIGGGMSNFMTGRGTANVLTRTTAILAACFMLTSVLLVVIPRLGAQAPSIIPEGTSTTFPMPAPGPTPAPATQPTTPAPTAPATPAGPTVPSGQ